MGLNPCFSGKPSASDGNKKSEPLKIIMYGPDRLRDVDALEFWLFGGVPENEAVYRDKVAPPESEGVLTGWVEYDLTTGKITIHDAPLPG
jgi:hypothetical protein